MFVIKFPNETNHEKVEEQFNLYQLQIEGLRKGWLIYPETLNPLTLTIKRKSKEQSMQLYMLP